MAKNRKLLFYIDNNRYHQHRTTWFDIKTQELLIRRSLVRAQLEEPEKISHRSPQVLGLGAFLFA